MPLNHNHTIYDNFVLSNEIEDQYNSMLNLMQFVTVDNSLVGTAGDIRKIHKYSATDGTERLVMGAGNTKNIEVKFTDEEYKILLVQNRFPYYDEEAMIDPFAVQTGVRHMAIDMFNSTNKYIMDEFKKGTMTVTPATFDFNAIVDAVAKLNLPETTEPGAGVFGFVNQAQIAELRKSLKDSLQYVEAYARGGYIGTVAGVNLYAKKDAPTDIVLATREAVTFFNKKGTEVEQERDANIRLNTIYSRKYYLPALTDDTKVVRIVKTP